MSNFQLDLGSSKPSGKSGGIGGTVFLILFATPFAGFGLFAIVQGVKKLAGGDTKDGLALCLFGLIFSAVGFGLMFGAVWGRKKAKQTAELQARYADKPWMLRADWAAGRIKSSATAQMTVFLIMALAFCGIGGLATAFALPEELHKGNYAVLLVLLFPLAGIGLLAAFVVTWRSRRRFGDCFFEPAQIPAPLGGTLEGMIQTSARVRLEHGLHLKLSCLRRVTTGSGKNRSTQEYILWQDEKIFKPGADLPEPEPGRTGIPVFFKLPADQPEATASNGDGIHWRLEARAKMSGPDFSVAFEVPVFKVAGAVVAEANESDPTAALQESVEELRRDEKSRIQVSDGPAGREFYFPAARNPTLALVTTAASIVTPVIAVVTFRPCADNGMMILLPIIFGLVGILAFLGAFSAWFKSSRITINPAGVRTLNSYLLFSRTRQFPADDVARFATKTGMQSGSQIFTDIRLVSRGSDEKFAARMKKAQDPQDVNQLVMARFREAAGPSGVTVAGSIASPAEANWLVAEMNKALGRKQ